MNNDTMNQREKLMGFFYVFLMFIAITTSCCLLIFYNNAHFKIFSQKDFVISRVEKIESYRKDQVNASAMVDSIYHHIDKFNPKISAIYEEDNIKNMLMDLKHVYERRNWDSRYKSFMHVSEFYYMWYADKKELWSKQENIRVFNKNLENCMLGLEGRRQSLQNDRGQRK